MMGPMRMQLIGPKNNVHVPCLKRISDYKSIKVIFIHPPIKQLLILGIFFLKIYLQENSLKPSQDQ